MVAVRIGPSTRLSRGGGSVVVNSDGSVTLTPASGKGTGVGMAPQANVLISAKGKSTSASDYILAGYDSSARLITGLTNTGRLDLITYSDTSGGIVALVLAPTTPANGALLGHYAFKGSNNSGYSHTMGLVGCTVTDVTASSMDSQLKFGFMAAVADTSTGGTSDNLQPNTYMTLDATGLTLPGNLILPNRVTFTSATFAGPDQEGGYRSKFYESGAPASSYGYGITGGQLWANVGTGGSYAWAVNGSNYMTLSGTDLTLGDFGLNIAVGTSTGSKIGTATNQKLGFWNAAPVTQYATTGTTTGFTAGAGTAVLSGSTFTGNTGSAAYTISDIVRCLKLSGHMAA